MYISVCIIILLTGLCFDIAPLGLVRLEIVSSVLFYSTRTVYIIYYTFIESLFLDLIDLITESFMTY